MASAVVATGETEHTLEPDSSAAMSCVEEPRAFVSFAGFALWSCAEAEFFASLRFGASSGTARGAEAAARPEIVDFMREICAEGDMGRREWTVSFSALLKSDRACFPKRTSYRKTACVS